MTGCYLLLVELVNNETLKCRGPHSEELNHLPCIDNKTGCTYDKRVEILNIHWPKYESLTKLSIIWVILCWPWEKRDRICDG